MNTLETIWMGREKLVEASEVLRGMASTWQAPGYRMPAATKEAGIDTIRRLAADMDHWEEEAGFTQSPEQDTEIDLNLLPAASFLLRHAAAREEARALTAFDIAPFQLLEGIAILLMRAADGR